MASGRRKLPVPPLPQRFPRSREKDMRPARLQALLAKRPNSTHQELAARYEAEWGIKLTASSISTALHLAGVFMRADQQHEQRQRPQRLARLVNSLASPTRDQLAELYRKRYHVTLSRPLISAALSTAGIRLVESPKKQDPDELAARPERLRAMAEAHPNLLYDELGRRYEAEHGVRLTAPVVARTLNRLHIYRKRLTDADELTERTQRIMLLAEQHPQFSADQLAEEYQHLYATKLHKTTVHAILRRRGQYRGRRPDAQELAARPARLKALAKRHPQLPAASLAEAYNQRYQTKLSGDTVSEALRELGIFRLTLVDPQELAQRSQRLAKLLQRFPRLTNVELGEKYAKVHGYRLSSAQVTNALTQLGIYRFRRPDGPEELRERPLRLAALRLRHPEFNHTQLAMEYARLYGTDLHRVSVCRTLCELEPQRQRRRSVDPNELAVRRKRLQTLKTKHPHATHADLAELYQSRYGVRLTRSSIGRALRNSNSALQRW